MLSLVVTVFGVGALASATGIFSPDMERLITAAMQFGTIVLVAWHNRHIRRSIEPKVDQIAAVTARKLGDRDSRTNPAPVDVVGWDGTERRGNNDA